MQKKIKQQNALVHFFLRCKKCTENLRRKICLGRKNVRCPKKIPFTTIVLDEITDVNEYSTSDTVSRSFNTLYPYQTRDEYSNFHTANVDKIFKFSELGTLKKLTIQFTDNLGVPFSIDNLNTSTWVKNEATDEIINGSTSLKSPSIYIRHPLHGNYQNHILFKVGTIETEIDKNIYC